MTTARWKVADVNFTYDGLIVQRVPNGIIKLYLAGTGTVGVDDGTPYPGTIWKNGTGVTGGDQWANPFTAGSSGAWELYLDPSEKADLKIVVTGTMPSGLTVGPLVADNVRPVPPSTSIVTGDKPGEVYLLDYAGGIDIANGGNAPGAPAGNGFTADIAIAGADAACIALKRNKIVVPPGYYLVKYVPTTGTTIEGAGKGRTVFWMQNGNSNAAYRNPIINSISIPDVTIKGISFDGRFATNNGYGFGTVVALDGNRCKMIDCEVYDYNHTGVTYGATDTYLESVDCYRTTIPTYPPTDGNTTGSTNYGGVYGFSTPGNTRPVRVRLVNCRAWNLRSAGCIVGGPDARIENFTGWNLHSGSFPNQTDALPSPPGPYETPGGCIATANTWNGSTSGAGANDAANQTVRTTNLVIIAPKIGPSAVGIFAQGIELSSADNVQIIGPDIRGCPGIGIKISWSSDILVIGGTLDGANPTGVAVGANGFYIDNGGTTGHDSHHINVIGTTIKNMTQAGAPNGNGVNIGNACDHIKFIGVTFDTNSHHWTNGSSGTDIVVRAPHVIGAGDRLPPPEVILTQAASLFALIAQNTSATGHGLQVAVAGATASQLVARFLAAGGASVAMDIVADGTALHRAKSGAATIVTLDTLNAAGVNPYLTLQRSGVTKAQIGLDASDLLAVIGADGTKRMTVNAATGATSLRSEAAGTDISIALGRTATEAFLAVVGNAGDFFAGTVASDVALRADAGDLWLGTIASKPIHIMAVNTEQIRIGTDGVLDYRNSQFGAGFGGSAAVLGNVSASSVTGPTNVSQQGWVKVKLAGTLYWLPAWTS